MPKLSSNTLEQTFSSIILNEPSPDRDVLGNNNCPKSRKAPYSPRKFGKIHKNRLGKSNIPLYLK